MMSRDGRVRCWAPLFAALSAAYTAGCSGGDPTETCAANDPECIERVANEDPENPVRETGREFRALRLGEDQCNIRSPGIHLGNPGGDGGPVMLDGLLDVVIFAPTECVPFRFFMNWCNFGVSPSTATQDIWLLRDSDMFELTESTLDIPALEPCECFGGTVSVAGLPAQNYQLISLLQPGRSFVFPRNFSVRGDGVASCG